MLTKWSVNAIQHISVCLQVVKKKEHKELPYLFLFLFEMERYASVSIVSILCTRQGEIIFVLCSSIMRPIYIMS